MTITIRSTTKIVKIDDMDCRVWEGATESGAPVTCLIPRIATTAEGDALQQFSDELVEHDAPSASLDPWPLRLVL
jgi:hypothetical protein